MPTTTITHEPWCAEHITEAGWNSCNTESFQFGPIDRSTEPPDHKGSMWLKQDENENDGRAQIVGSYGDRWFRMNADDAQVILNALRDDAQAVVAALEANLSQIDAQ